MKSKESILNIWRVLMCALLLSMLLVMGVAAEINLEQEVDFVEITIPTGETIASSNDNIEDMEEIVIGEDETIPGENDLFFDLTEADGIEVSDVLADELLIEDNENEVDVSIDQTYMNNAEDFEIDGNGVLVKYHGPGGDVVIPDGVVSIGNNAFRKCKSLTGVSFPVGLTSIKRGAFSLCYNLTKVSLPDSLREIGDWGFWACRSLKSISIPQSVSSIGDAAFSGCDSLISIDVSEDNSYFSSIDGILYRNTDMVIISCPGGKSAVNIAKGTKEIGEFAFAFCNSLEDITIPSSVTNIGWSAFFSCNSLTSVEVPSSVSRIEIRAFSACVNMVSITVSSNNSWFSSVDGVLYRNENKELVSCPGEKTSVCIPDGIKSIGVGACYSCMSLTSVIIPTSVNSIGFEAFYNCPNLTIYGKKGSYAEQYAKENGIPFKISSSSEQGLTIDQGEKATLYMGNKLTLTTNSNNNLVWQSSKKDVATVSSKGVVTPKKAGTTIITVKSEDNQTASIEMKVVDVKSVNIIQGKETVLKVGGTLALEAKLLPDGVKSKLQWESSRPKVATVTEKGIVKAVKEGTTTITVTTANKITATIQIKVSNAVPSKIRFVNVKQVNINLGETQTLITKIEPKGVTSKLTWISSNPKIVSVSQKGEVMGLKKGNAKITVSTENNKKATIKVNVSNPCDPTSIVITDKTSRPLSMNVGQVLQLHTLIDPVNAETTLTWKSSKNSVVNVYSGGVIEAIKAGKATITVKTNNNKSDKIEIEVLNPSVASGIKLNTKELETIERGELLQLRAILIPETAITDLTWSSSNEYVATVDSNGLVKGLKKGTTVITVKTNNKKSAKVRVRVLNSVKEPTEGSENPRFYTEGLLLPSGKIQIGTVPDIQGIISLRNGLISKLRIDIGTNGEVVLSKEEPVNDTLVNLVSMKEKLGIDKLPTGKYATGVFVLADGDTDYTKIGETEIFDIVTEGADDAEDAQVKAAKLFVKDKTNNNLFTNAYVSAVLKNMDIREMLLIGIVKRSDMQWGRIGSYFNGSHNNEYLVRLYEAEIMDTIRYINKTEFTDKFKIVDKNKKFWIDEICDASGALTTIAEDGFGVKISNVLEKTNKLLKYVKDKLKDKKITNDLAVAIADNLINYEKGQIVLDSIKESSEHSGNKAYLEAFDRVKAQFYNETSGVLIESLEDIKKYLLKGTIKDIEEVFTHATCKVAGAVKTIFDVTISIVSKVSGAEEIAENYETFLIQAELYMAARESYNEAFKQVKGGDYSTEAINRLSTTLDVAKAAAIRIHETILKLDKTKSADKSKIKAYLKDLRQYHTL